MLIETGEAILVHSYDRDNFYAAGLDQAGVKNWATENEGKTIKVGFCILLFLHKDYYRFLRIWHSRIRNTFLLLAKVYISKQPTSNNKFCVFRQEYFGMHGDENS